MTLRRVLVADAPAWVADVRQGDLFAADWLTEWSTAVPPCAGWWDVRLTPQDDVERLWFWFTPTPSFRASGGQWWDAKGSVVGRHNPTIQWRGLRRRRAVLLGNADGPKEVS